MMREKAIRPITFVLILILGWVLYRTFIVPKRRGVQSLQRTLKSIELQLNSLLGEEATLRGGPLEKEALEKELERLVLKIPSERDIPKIINQLVSEVGKGLKIDYTLIEPKEVLSEGNYKKVPLELKFLSTYGNFTSYLNRLEKSPMLTRIESLDLMSVPGARDKIEIHMLLSAFVMPAAGEAVIERITLEAVVKPSPVSPFAPKEVPREGAPEPRVRAEKAPAFVLQGVFGKEGKLSALINDRMVQHDDIIQGWLVVKIDRSGVILQRGTRRIELKLP